MITRQLAQRHHIDAVISYAEGDRSGVSSPETELIGRSWTRCIREFGLDPSRPRSARIVTQQTLREHQDSVDEFLNVARAGVEQLYGIVSQLGYVLLLTDHRGITVQYLGDRRSDRRLRHAGLYLGADWSEQYAGTCAVGTCIQEQQALTCHRVDHFDASHISLTCTSAPIRDPSGELLAVLDISALDSPDARHSQTFALNLTQLYARMIEDAFFLRKYRNQVIFRCDVSREFVQVNGQYLFAIDENGRVKASNTAGRSLIEDSRASGILELRPDLTRLFDCQLEDIWSIPHDQEDQVRAFRHHGSGRTFFAALIQPRNRPSKHSESGTLSTDDPVPGPSTSPEIDPVSRLSRSIAPQSLNH